MPKFSSKEARKSFEDRLIQRRVYAAEKIDEVLPKVREAPIPLHELFDRATAAAVKDGLAEHEYFGKADDPPVRFRSFVEENWGGVNGIRQTLADHCGTMLEYGDGIKGVRRAGKPGILATNKWHASVVKGGADVHNALAVSAQHREIDAVGVQLRILPAP